MTHNKNVDRKEEIEKQWKGKSEENQVAVDIKEVPYSHKTEEVENSPKGIDTMSLVTCTNGFDQSLDLGKISLCRTAATTFKVCNLELPSFTPEQIHHFHAINFQRLVRAVYLIEEELARTKTKLDTQIAIKDSSTSKKNHDSSKVHDTMARRSCRIQELNFTPEDNSLALNPIQNVDVERTLRNRRRILNRYVGNLAEQLTNFERAIFFQKNDRIGNAQTVYPDDIMIFANPMDWENHVSEIVESDSHNIISKSNIEEYNHTSHAHVKDILKRSYDILMQWKMSLKVGDRISASDYMDEYVCNNEKVGWTMLYEAVIRKVLSGPPESNSKTSDRIYKNIGLSSKEKDSASSIFVKLGDSSSKHKQKRELRQGEKAILVHYIGYPKDEDRWLMINPKHEKIDGIIFPNHSQMLSFEALRKSSCSQLEYSRATVDNNNCMMSEAAPNIAERKQNNINNSKSIQSAKSSKSSSEFEAEKDSSHPRMSSIQKEEQRHNYDSEGEIKLERIVQEMLESQKNKILDKDWESIRSLHFQGFEIQQLKEKWLEIISKNQKRKMNVSKNIKETIEMLEKQNLSKSVMDISTKSMISKRKAELNGILIEEPDHKRLKNSQYSSLESENSYKENSNQLHKSNNSSRLSTTSNQPKNGKIISDMKQKDDPELSFTWICVECREAECIADPESPLIVCEGLCNRPFHIPCAGLAEIPKSDEMWVCNDCQKRRHQCAVCHQYGEDDKDVFKCAKHNCGLFFHIACLNMYNVDVEIIDHNVNLPYIENDINRENKMDIMKNTLEDEKRFSKQNIIDLKQQNMSGIKFKCPAHFCWTCSSGVPPTSDDNGKETTQEKLGNKKRINDDGKSVSSLATIANAFKGKKGVLFVS